MLLLFTLSKVKISVYYFINIKNYRPYHKFTWPRRRNKVDIRIIKTENAPAAKTLFPQAVRAGDTLYVSGQLPIDMKTGLIPTDIREQVRCSMNNISEVLKAAGGSLENAVRMTIYLKDLDTFDSVNEVYASYFKESLPARTTVEVARLPKDALIEIDCIAAL
ncbi:MAG: hypothetical protein GX250_08725 [Clostridiales bacterium]|nr:hypothetical protein [Clostridiales bacterium]